MASLTFSEQFSAVMQKLVKALPKSPVLIFREDGLTRMSYTKNGLLLHLSASPEDFSYDGKMVGLSTLSEFNDCAKAVGYPKVGEISLVREVAMSGHAYEFVKFTGNHKRLRCRLVDLAFFSEDSQQVPFDRESNPLKLVGKLSLSQTAIKDIFNSRKFAPGCDNVTITCQESKIVITLRGTVGQQVDLDYTYPYVQIDQEVAAQAYANSILRMFPLEMFHMMDAVGLDYEIELRYMPGPNGGQMALCSYASFPGVSGNPISVYIGSVEAEAATIANIDIRL